MCLLRVFVHCGILVLVIVNFMPGSSGMTAGVECTVAEIVCVGICEVELYLY